MRVSERDSFSPTCHSERTLVLRNEERNNQEYNRSRTQLKPNQLILMFNKYDTRFYELDSSNHHMLSQALRDRY